MTTIALTTTTTRRRFRRFSDSNIAVYAMGTGGFVLHGKEGLWETNKKNKHKKLHYTYPSGWIVKKNI